MADEEIEIEGAEVGKIEDLPEKFQQFLAEHDLGESTLVTRIYRVTRQSRRGPATRVLVGKYDGHVPDENEVGEDYGRGIYQVIATTWDRQKKQSFTASSQYNLDDPVWEKKPEPMQGKSEVADNRSMMMNAMWEQQKHTMEMIIALVGALNGRGDSGDRLLELQNKMFTQNMKIQGEILDSQRQLSLPLEEEGGEEMDTKDMIRTVIDLVVERAGEYLGASAPKKAITRRMVTNMPEFQQIASDPDAVKEMISEVGKKIGPEKATQVAKDFGLVS